MQVELKERVDTLRKRFEELHDQSLSGNFGNAAAQEFHWLQQEIQLVQAEALVRLSYRSWM
jgi:hypothetical protein